MSFLRHWENYRHHQIWVRKRQPELTPPPHRVDEYPVGYSWRVALQQSPLPLHQLRLILAMQSVDGKNCFWPRIAET
jgi:hypothetical protein